MGYAALIVPGVNDPRRFDVIVTITREDGNIPDLAEPAVAARHAAAGRAVDGDLMFAYTAQKVITSMTVAGTPDESSAVAVAVAVAIVLAVVSEALRMAPQPSQWPGRGSS
jgi:hypothetical protein